MEVSKSRAPGNSDARAPTADPARDAPPIAECGIAPQPCDAIPASVIVRNVTRWESYILLSILSYLAAPGPWSDGRSGAPRHLHRRPTTHAAITVKLPYFSPCYLCGAVYVVAVR